MIENGAIWCDYVEQASQMREHELQEEYAAGYVGEQKMGKFLEMRHRALEPLINFANLQSYSQLSCQRLQEKAEGARGEGYNL